jgi:hypothetical protein
MMTSNVSASMIGNRGKMALVAFAEYVELLRGRREPAMPLADLRATPRAPPLADLVYTIVDNG